MCIRGNCVDEFVDHQQDAQYPGMVQSLHYKHSKIRLQSRFLHNYHKKTKCVQTLIFYIHIITQILSNNFFDCPPKERQYREGGGNVCMYGCMYVQSLMLKGFRVSEIISQLQQIVPCTLICSCMYFVDLESRSRSPIFKLD